MLHCEILHTFVVLDLLKPHFVFSLFNFLDCSLVVFIFEFVFRWVLLLSCITDVVSSFDFLYYFLWVVSRS